MQLHFERKQRYEPFFYEKGVPREKAEQDRYLSSECVCPTGSVVVTPNYPLKRILQAYPPVSGGIECLTAICK